MASTLMEEQRLAIDGNFGLISASEFVNQATVKAVSLREIVPLDQFFLHALSCNGRLSGTRKEWGGKCCRIN
jgi:hypothetical protein